MKAPDDWWPGYLSHALNSGVIACVDLDIDTNNHFQLELDKERGVFYAMRYDAVVCYADKMHCSFSLFCLSAHALSNPANEVIVVETVNKDDDDDDKYITPPPARNKQCRLQKKQSTINSDSSAFGKEGTADNGIADKTVEKPDAINEVVRELRKRRGRRAAAKPGTTQYTLTDPGDWTKISAANPG